LAWPPDRPGTWLPGALDRPSITTEALVRISQSRDASDQVKLSSENHFLAYATSPGATASDGNGRNGIYTKHLLASLKSPDTIRDDIAIDGGPLRSRSRQ
jgi:hypothetical protein